MTHDVEVIDLGDHPDFEPLPHDDFDRISYDDIPEVRPSMHQRMSSLSVNDNKPNTKSRRDSTLDRDNYAYWRLEKEGEDWGSAFRRKIMAPQNEIEKLAKKGKGSVLSETKRMGSLRSQHLQRLVDDLNDSNVGDARWEPVYIDSVKISRRSGRVECKSMDVILARRQRSPKPSKKYRSASSGELVDIITEAKPKGDKKDKKKEKDYSSSPKRDSVIDDPFGSAALFHSSGRPMDDQGIIEFKNGGLPPDIPADRPIGFGAREERTKDDKKDKKRSKSKDQEEEEDFAEIIEVGDEIEPGPAIDSVDALLGRETSEDVPLAEPGRRSSHSRRRSKGSRARSPYRPESISFPPNYQLRQYPGDPGDSSSVSSVESRYGIDREERSSYTSQDTYASIGRRGSHFDEGRPKVYREHHRGPSKGPSGDGGPAKYYHPHGDTKVYEEPARSNRRYSRGGGGGYYPVAERIPEARQIGYRDYAGEVARRASAATDPIPGPYDDLDPYYSPRGRAGAADPRGPILHYPNEMPEKRAERYMDDLARDDLLAARERDIRERELRMDAVARREEEYRREEEWRLARERERDMDELDRRAAEARYAEAMERRRSDSRQSKKISRETQWETEREREREQERRYYDDRYRGERGYGYGRDYE